MALYMALYIFIYMALYYMAFYGYAKIVSSLASSQLYYIKVVLTFWLPKHQGTRL